MQLLGTIFIEKFMWQKVVSSGITNQPGYDRFSTAQK
jgi:hypothetical protein